MTLKIIKEEKGDSYSIIYEKNILVHGFTSSQMADTINRKKTSKKYQEYLGKEDMFMDKFDKNIVSALLKAQFMRLVPRVKNKKKITQEVVVIKNTSFDEIQPTEFEEVISVCILCGQYELKNPMWMQILAAPAVGKSEELIKFKDPRIVHWAGRQTKNVALAGKSNRDADDPYSTLVAANKKCLIYNDVAILLGGSDETLSNLLGLLTDVFGKGKLVIEDPGGRREYDSYFSIIMGMTRRQYFQLLPFITKMGQRFLIYNVPTNFNVCHYDQDDRDRGVQEKRKKHLVSHVINTSRQHSTLPRYNEDMKRVAKEFAIKIVTMRTMCWELHQEVLLEHYQRLMNILLNAAVMRAALWNREPETDDVRFFFKLAIPTIYRFDLFEKMFVNENANVFSKKDGVKFNILVSNLKTLGIFDGDMNYLINEYEEVILGVSQ